MNKYSLIREGGGSVIADDISDGYHTFSELYDHRCLLFIALCSSSRRIGTASPKWVRNHYVDWDLLAIGTVNQVSYHIPVKYRHLLEQFQETTIEEIAYDGHTSADVLKRLEEFCKL